MKVSRNDLKDLSGALDRVGSLIGVKFVYATAKNKDMIATEIRELSVGLKPTDKFKEYDKKRIVLCKKYAEQDKGGEPLMKPVPGTKPLKMEYIIADEDAFSVELKTLNAEYKPELDKKETLLEEFNEAMKDEIDFEFHMLEFKDVPENITAKQLSDIFCIIEGAQGGKSVKEDKKTEISPSSKS